MTSKKRVRGRLGCPKPGFKARISAKPLIRKSFFTSHANETYFRKKKFVLCLVLKVRVFGTWKWPILCFVHLVITRTVKFVVNIIKDHASQ